MCSNSEKCLWYKSEVPGADDGLFKGDSNSGISMLVGKDAGRQHSQVPGWLTRRAGSTCRLSVCLNTHLLLCFLVPQWETDEERTVALWDGGGGPCAVLWNYGLCFFSVSKF